MQRDGGMHALTKFLWRWGPALAMMALIFFASGTSGPEMPSFGILDLLVKKGGHMLGYGLLATAYLRGLTAAAKAGRGAVLLAVVMAVIYAATDEFHQSFIPGRNPSAADVGIDTIGAVLGAAASAWIHAKR
jgi:hypothetical protein